MSTATTRSSPCWTATPLALSFLGGALGADQRCLGTDQFGQSGLPHEVYDALQIGQTHIEDACREVVGCRG